MAVPPLHHCVDDAGISAVRLGRGHRDGHAVRDVQHRHRDDEGGEEPVRNVDVLDLAERDRAKEHDCIGDPYGRYQQVDRPFEFGVFLALRESQGKRHRRGEDDELPAPKSEGGQPVAEQSCMTGTLHDVIGSGEQRASAEREYHCIRMQWPQTAVGQPGYAEVEFRPQQLCRNDDPDEHTDDAPYHGHNRELPDHLVVVMSGRRFHSVASRS